MNSPQNQPFTEIVCPGCGRDIHIFHLPTRPGIYRLRCQSDSDKMIRLVRNADESVTIACKAPRKKLAK